MSENEAASQACRSRYWVIVDPIPGGLDVLKIALAGGEEALAVFSFREEAELFLHCELSNTDWRVRETTAGELASLLYDLYPGVGKVALDALPNVCGEANVLLSLRREKFVLNLIGGLGAPAMTLGQSSLQAPISPAIPRDNPSSP